MASSAYGSMSFHQPKAQRSLERTEMENWIDFNSMPSPGTSMSRKPSQLPSSMNSPNSIMAPFDVADEHQTPVVPSFDYSRNRQTFGLPGGSLAGLQPISEDSSASFMGYNSSGLDDFNFGASAFGGMGSSTGLSMGDFSLDESLAGPTFSYADGSMADSFINPAVVTKQEDTGANVRFFPGMHQQQAAQAKAQAEAQAQQQRQHHQQMMLAQQKQRQARNSLDPRTEETIARVVNQIRQNSIAQSHDGFSDSVLPHVARPRKDEEDMDEDERLLNSEEGKKLSSKERRQLRNKVSARAFRSRRKEYIGQLEGELASKASDATELQIQNRALLEENARFRALAEKLLRHPAFHPFLEDLSRDPELAASLSQIASSSSLASSRQSEHQQMSIPPPQAETQHIGMALMPEPTLDFSSLNLGNTNNNWVVPSMGMSTFQQPSVFAVHDIVTREPVELTSMVETNKGESVLDRFTEDLEAKLSIPIIESVKLDRVNEVETEVVDVARTPAAYDFDEEDETVTLYAQSKTSSSSLSSTSSSLADLTIDIPLSLLPKPHFEILDMTESDLQVTDVRLARLIAKMDRVSARVGDLTRSY